MSCGGMCRAGGLVPVIVSALIRIDRSGETNVTDLSQRCTCGRTSTVFDWVLGAFGAITVASENDDTVDFRVRHAGCLARRLENVDEEATRGAQSC